MWPGGLGVVEWLSAVRAVDNRDDRGVFGGPLAVREALTHGTRDAPHSTSPPGDVRVSGRANTPCWVCREARPSRALGSHQLSQGSSTHSHSLGAAGPRGG
jgi:hypothetical protein